MIGIIECFHCSPHSCENSIPGPRFAKTSSCRRFTYTFIRIMIPTSPPSAEVVQDVEDFESFRQFDQTITRLSTHDASGKKTKTLIQQHVRDEWNWLDRSRSELRQPLAKKFKWHRDVASRNLELRRREEDSDFLDDFSHTPEGDHITHDEDTDCTQTSIAAGSHHDKYLSKNDGSSVIEYDVLFPKGRVGSPEFEARRNAWTGAVHCSIPTASGFAEPHTASDSMKDGQVSDSSIQRRLWKSQDDLLPVLPSWLPNHPIRTASSQEKNYGEIYTKFVVTGTTPNIPINLRDVVRCCVVGWKRDGLWAEAGKQGGQLDKKDLPQNGLGERRSITERPRGMMRRGAVSMKNGFVNTVKCRTGSAGSRDGDGA